MKGERKLVLAPRPLNTLGGPELHQLPKLI